MILTTCVDPQLPHLAWGAWVRPSGVELRCGDWVEHGDDFFFEGVWNGPFRGVDFLRATFVAGSGARLTDGGIQFISPSHTLEGLHSVRQEHAVFISNSIVWAFVESGGCPDPGFPFYDRDCLSVLDGLSVAKRHLPTRGGEPVRLHHYEAFRLDAGLAWSGQRRAIEKPFVDFNDYCDRVSTAVGQLIANAADDARRHSFRPITTISAGYDSPAVSVFAVQHGCLQALTFREARDNFGVADDSGHAVARFLGLSVEEFDRNEYRRRDDFPEAEFLSTGNGGEDVVMCGLERVLPRRVLFTGFRGDTVWAKSEESPFPSLDFVQKDPSGSSLGEFRLRVGFFHIPLPAMTFLQHPSIQAISNSPKMNPWSIASARSARTGGRVSAARGLTGAGYDRPIPRRLVEERGVPRDAFGWRKAAISQPFYNNENLENKMSPASIADFRAFRARRESSARLQDRVTAVAGAAVNSLNNALAKVGRLVGVYVPLVVPRRYRQSITENAFTFQWAHEHLSGRYAPRRNSPAADVARKWPSC